MADSLTRHLGLLRQDPNGFIRVSELNKNFESLDNEYSIIETHANKAATPNFTICTSTTRPLFPADGDEIFETDTKYRSRWRLDKADWEIVANKPFAQLYKVTGTDAQASTGRIRFVASASENGVSSILRGGMKTGASMSIKVPVKGLYEIVLSVCLSYTSTATSARIEIQTTSVSIAARGIIPLQGYNSENETYRRYASITKTVAMQPGDEIWSDIGSTSHRYYSGPFTYLSARYVGVS